MKLKLDLINSKLNSSVLRVEIEQLNSFTCRLGAHVIVVAFMHMWLSSSWCGGWLLLVV